MIDIIYNYSVCSTNDLAMACDEPWSLFVAEEQTLGRGQAGNSWESEPGKNLTFSLVVKPDFVRASEQFYISKITSLALVYALEDSGVEPKIKWPNDIYVGDKKICGILIENRLSASGAILKSVLGVGLNINQEQFASDAPNPISMVQVTGESHNRNSILGDFAMHFVKLYELLSQQELERIDEQYELYLYRLHERHLYREGGELFEGVIAEVMPTGELIIEKDGGQRCSYLFKEVEFVINPSI